MQFFTPLGAYRSAITSSKLQTWSEIPAFIAGVTRNALLLEHLARGPEQDLVYIHFVGLAHRKRDCIRE